MSWRGQVPEVRGSAIIGLSRAAGPPLTEVTFGERQQAPRTTRAGDAVGEG